MRYSPFDELLAKPSLAPVLGTSYVHAYCGFVGARVFQFISYKKSHWCPIWSNNSDIDASMIKPAAIVMGCGWAHLDVQICFRNLCSTEVALSWEMKLGSIVDSIKISKSAGSIQWIICWWPKTCGDEGKPHEKCPSCKRQGPVPMLISSSSRRCVKQGVRRYKLWTRHLHPSNLCEIFWPFAWTCQYKQTNKQTQVVLRYLATTLNNNRRYLPFHQFSREHFTQLSGMFEKSPFLSKAKALSWNLMEYQTFS